MYYELSSILNHYGEDITREHQRKRVIAQVLLVLFQAYFPHGEAMRDYVDDLADQLNDIFRKGRQEEEDDDHSARFLEENDTLEGPDGKFYTWQNPSP